LILLDLMMPGMDGMEVCRRIKASPRTIDIPVIFLTAANDAENAAKALGQGAVDYIFKPFNTAELLARVRTHVALKRTRDELYRIIKQKNELLSVVAHDLKNPLSSIRFSAIMLKESGVVEPDPRAELVNTIIDTCGNALDFIQQGLSRNAQSALLEHVHLAPVELLDVLTQVIQENLPLAYQKQIELDLDFDESLSHVTADREAFARALNNLVSNAIKFSPKGRGVLVKVRPSVDAKSVRLSVIDQGPGLNADDLKHLFEPYRRLSAQPTGGESSTGLGLSITRDLVTKMGGQIGCESNGSGATFWVELPKL
ncbi:MAG: hybrid sensor histidine kinase/response regulator, partial [Opitutaceae bacterium]